MLSIAPAPASSDTPATGFGFGMDAASIKLQTDAGVKPDYGTFWVGPWTLTSGWGGPNSQLDSMRSQGVTPAIHYYYWGDDISQDCVENGCWSTLHNTWKDQAGWQKLAEELVTALNNRMKGDRVVIFMETEFNKGDMQRYAPFDAQLAEKARAIKAGYPAADIVLAFGNWNSPAWTTWEQAMAASDYAGIQGMRGSTRHTETQYLTLYEATLDGARTMQQLFNKPVFITDIALSSYPEPEYLQHQEAALAKFFTGMDALQEAGAAALLYRAWHDHPTKNLANYFGEAERHWGFSYPKDNTLKPAGNAWIQGVNAVRAGPVAEPEPEPPANELSASFRVGPNINEWWVEVYVDASNPLTAVHARAGDGSWMNLPKTDWDSWARSFHVPAGTEVVFRATDTDGQRLRSGTYLWLQGWAVEADEPTAEEPAAGDPAPEEPTAEEPAAEEPAGGSSGGGGSAGEEPTAEEPTAEEPTTEKPTAEEPSPTLTATGHKVRGRHIVDLAWTSLSGETVTIHRDGRAVATWWNDGAYRDEPGGRGGGSYSYKVCATDGTGCVGPVTVQF